MIAAILKETIVGETRVAATPKTVLELIMLEQNKLQVDLNKLMTTATSLPATSCSLPATSFGHDRIGKRNI